MLTGTILDIEMYDLAGYTVIHSTGAWALLAAIMIMGPRKGRHSNGGSVGSISSVENANVVPVFDKFELDDPVGALSVHLVNGLWGTLAVGIFVSDISFISQLKGVVLIGIFAFVSSYLVIYIINKIVKFRAEDDAQVEGMDVNECGVEAYPEFKRAI